MGVLVRWLAALCVVVAVTMLTGCGGVLDDPYKATSEADTAAAAAKLVPLPTLEETERHLQEVMVELADHVSALVPGLQWHWSGQRLPSSCDRPFDQTEGRRVHLPDYVASGPIPDSVWPQALQRARELAASLGGVSGQGFKDQPRDHDVRFYSPEGTAVWFGTAIKGIIGGDTGCRLPAAVKNPPVGPAPTP